MARVSPVAAAYGVLSLAMLGGYTYVNSHVERPPHILLAGACAWLGVALIAQVSQKVWSSPLAVLLVGGHAALVWSSQQVGCNLCRGFLGGELVVALFDVLYEMRRRRMNVDLGIVTIGLGAIGIGGGVFAGSWWSVPANEPLLYSNLACAGSSEWALIIIADSRCDSCLARIEILKPMVESVDIARVTVVNGAYFRGLKGTEGIRYGRLPAFVLQRQEEYVLMQEGGTIDQVVRRIQMNCAMLGQAKRSPRQ